MHWGTLAIGIVVGVAIAHILLRVGGSSGGAIQQAPAAQWPN